jgi:Tannase and feruloyl esterase
MPTTLSRYRVGRAVFAFVVVSLLTTATATASAGPTSLANSSALAILPTVACTDLAGMDFSDVDEAPTHIDSATVVAATATTPEYCRILGFVEPQVRFEVRLPTQTWNGRYMQTGGGGFGGNVPINSCADILSENYAVAAHNTGHVGGGAEWGRNDEQLRIDFAHRSTHVTAVAAKALIAAFYGQGPAFSYFRGCSTGGREGLMEAVRYPADFDGILIGHVASPALQGAGANNWLAQYGSRPDPLGAGTDVIMSDAKATLLHDAVMDACDGLDGLVDGLLNDPRNCDFDPSTLACPGADAPDCLTAEELTVAEKYYDGPRNSDGTRLYPGTVPYGSELGWPSEPPRSAGFANGQLRNLQYPIKKNPPDGWTFYDFDFDEDFNWGQLKYGWKLYDPLVPDLSAFHAMGGKLIHYHGWSDVSVSAKTAIDYYTEVADSMGGPQALDDWYRLFLIPGAFHCGGGGVRLGATGPSPAGTDAFLALVDWVESDTAPDTFTTRYFQGSTVVRTRPVFPYPQVAEYDGTGSIDDAANFVAADPPVAHDGDIHWLFDPGPGMNN